MSKEYEHWRKEAIQCNQALEDQQKITEEVVQPLQDQLAELEEQIREQQGKVNSIKSQILRNDITIGNLLYSVIQTRWTCRDDVNSNWYALDVADDLFKISELFE